MMQCPNCSTNIVDESIYCPRCAERLPRENGRVAEKNDQLPVIDTALTASDHADLVSAKVAKAFFWAGVAVVAFMVIIAKMSFVAKLAVFLVLVGFLWVLSSLFVRGGAFFVSWLSAKIRKK